MNNFFKELLDYTDSINAKYIYELVADFILKKYGSEYLNIRGICIIPPSDLCKLVGEDADVFNLICHIIYMYKFKNNLEIGFESNKYVTEYVSFREKQQHKKQKYRDSRVRKVCKQVIEEFPDDLITEISVDDYINFLKERNDIEILEPNENMNNYTRLSKR